MSGVGSPLRLPYGFARRHRVLILGDEHTERLQLTCAELPSGPVLCELQRHFRRPLHIETCAPDQFEELLAGHYRDGNAESRELVADMEEVPALTSLARELAEPEDLLDSQDEAPIIRLINALLAEGLKESASDIHIEPYERHLSVRFRVDGVLRELLRPPVALAPAIVSRVKVMAQLDIAEKRLPQDGRMSLRVGGRPVDVRVSTLPSGHGERVVLRLLDKKGGALSIEQLGMPEDDARAFESVVDRPHGILLVTGPTGSGKTTSLYAALTRLNDGSRNIITVEDPVEYDLPGVGQTQVNSKVGLSFARGLRAILRQDPDVVMVGEIRDRETAEIAVQASLTGHMVLSTLHTNTALGAVIRLRDMGIEPFLIGSSLSGLAAQRLVRRLCPHCREAHAVNDAERQLLGLSGNNVEHVVYRAVGCERCNGLGYRGRLGVFEVVPVDEEMRGLIVAGADEQTLARAARKRSRSIRDNAARQVLDGHTSLDEMLRVFREA